MKQQDPKIDGWFSAFLIASMVLGVCCFVYLAVSILAMLFGISLS